MPQNIPFCLQHILAVLPNLQRGSDAAEGPALGGPAEQREHPGCPICSAVLLSASSPLHMLETGWTPQANANNPGSRVPHPNTSSGVLNLMPMAAANALLRRTSTIVCGPIGVVVCMMHTWEVQHVGPETGMRYVTGSKQSASICCNGVSNMVLSLKSPHHMQRGWLIKRQVPPPYSSCTSKHSLVRVAVVALPPRCIAHIEAGLQVCGTPWQHTGMVGDSSGQCTALNTFRP